MSPTVSREYPLTESFLHIDLATPYRSTIAITNLACFLAKCEHKDEDDFVPEKEFGSDVEGKKPIVFDVGKSKVKLRDALQRSRDLFGDDATLLYDGFLPSSMREICQMNGKENGGPWECYDAFEFIGWESNKVVAITTGRFDTLGMVTRAKTQLIVILAEPAENYHFFKQFYANYQRHFHAAADRGLVELDEMAASAFANESKCCAIS